MRGVLIGILLIDKHQIILRIYQEVETNSWQKLYQENFPLAMSDSLKLTELITQVFATIKNVGVGEWCIYTKFIESSIINELNSALNMKVKLLSIESEQDYIFQGLLKEIISWH